MDGHLIELRDVVKTYSVGTGSFTALRGINLRVSRGEFVAVIGKSGSGKSTLINMITGIDRPTSGEVFVDDTAVHRLNENQMAVWRGRNVGVVFQFFQLLPMLAVVENVMLPMDFCESYPDRERYDRAMELLTLVGMEDQARKLPTAISGGQQQRVAIARALANDPPILVADEPTGNLDTRMAAAIFELFDQLVRQGKTIVLVTHDTELAKRVQRAVIVSDGEIIEEYLARNFPTLDRDQLVAVTRRLKPEVFAPGALIVRQGEPGDKFYLITRGQAEVVLHGLDRQEIVVATLTAGQYFGEVALIQGGRRIADVRASLAEGAEALSLSRPDFEAMVGAAPEVGMLLEQVARQRLAENVAAQAGGPA
jgi:ABC-type lipoprotein export system ATPase subunit